MQSITAAIKSPPFLGVFFGTAVLALLLGLAAPFTWSEPGALYLSSAACSISTVLSA